MKKQEQKNNNGLKIVDNRMKGGITYLLCECISILIYVHMHVLVLPCICLCSDSHIYFRNIHMIINDLFIIMIITGITKKKCCESF